MKRCFLIAMVVCVTVIFTDTTYGGMVTGINILSQTYHVWGCVTLDGEVVESYDIQDNVPVSGSVSFPSGWGTPAQSSSTGNFMVDTKSYAIGMYPDGYYQTSGGAQIDYTFQPQTDSLQIAFNGNGGIYTFTNSSVFELKDLDTLVVLDSRSWEYDQSSPVSIWQDDILPYYGSYTVIPDHTYLMTISAQSSQPDIWYGSAHLEAVVTPEPTTFLLLGLGGLLVRKKEFN